ncbi:MAG: hypothetical protein KatS3mg105_2377 [Gemmatales bacterium]|nr:MAG: hypothetical protein KatS3mg105_2377 [Gemmatales bacterium]
MEIHTRQQSLYETIFAKAGQQREAAKNLWNNIHTIVFHYASKNVPYDPTEDAWHAPSTAVWQAAWTAGLVGVCRMLNQDIPDDLEQQWRWFQEGHWPCALENENGNKHVVVY